MQARLTEEMINETSVYYMRRIGAYGAENYVLMERMKDWLKEHELYREDTVIYAVPLDNPEITEASKCRYDVCVADDGSTIGKELGRRCLEGGRYVVLRIAHTPEAVAQAWSEGLSVVEESGYRCDFSRPIMERYQKKLVDEHYCELCVPVL